MDKITSRIIYFLVVVVLLLGSVCFGYITTIREIGYNVDNPSLIEYAKEYVFQTKDRAVTASTKTYDISVVYEDNYLICGEKITNKKMVYGTTIDKVKEDEKASQEEKGIMYNIKSETIDSIVYTRNINENCPNHFLVIYEEGRVNVYTIRSEKSKDVYMTLDNINISNLRDELKQKLEKGAYFNSKDELNSFIEDIET